MTTKAEEPTGRMDALRWAAGALLVVLGLAGFYYFQNQSLLFRVIGLLVLAAAAGAIFLQTTQGRLAWAFVQDSRTEVRKVVWPTRKETVQTTSIVVAMVAVMAIFLWLLDMLLAWGVREIIGRGG